MSYSVGGKRETKSARRDDRDGSRLRMVELEEGTQLTLPVLGEREALSKSSVLVGFGEEPEEN